MTTQSKRWIAPQMAMAAVRALTGLLLLGALAVIIGAVTVLVVVPRVTGAEALTVVTGSMTPKIPVGSIVLVRPVDTGTLQVGDVATYRTDPGQKSFITHRIVGIDTSTTPDSFVFKGDANRGPDVKPVSADAIRGEVWFHVPYLGAVRDGLPRGAGLSLLAALLVAGLAASLLVSAMRDRRRGAGRDERARGKLDVACDRAVILAEIRTSAVLGTPPSEAAKEWGGVLLRQTESSFTVLIAPGPWDVAAIVRDLQIFDPVSLDIVEAPQDISLHLDATSAQIWRPVSVERVGNHVA